MREKSVKGIIPFTDLSLRSLYLLVRPRTHETSGTKVLNRRRRGR